MTQFWCDISVILFYTIGMKPNNFDIMHSLGIGGTAEVFAARNTDKDRTVALKCFAQHLVRDEDAVLRLRNEVDALHKLKHPNIVGLHGVYEEADSYFALELELVAGKHLGDWNEAYDIPLIEPKLWMLAQLARGIGAAHERGILHRDLKPENVLVSNRGDVKITDFGLARLLTKITVTRLGLLVGSLGYMAPEVINGERATVHADIFSFGVLAYELLCGKSPFVGETPQELIKKIVDGDFRPLQEEAPSVPIEVASLINKSLSVDKSQRPQGIWDFEAALLATIQQTGLMPYCAKLCGEETRHDELKEALSIRLDTIKSALDSAMEDMKNRKPSSQERREILYLASELRRIYPEDPAAGDYLVQFAGGGSASTEKNTKRYALAIVLFLFLGTGTWFWGQKFSDSPSDQMNSDSSSGAGLETDSRGGVSEGNSLEAASAGNNPRESADSVSAAKDDSAANPSSRNGSDAIRSRSAAVARPAAMPRRTTRQTTPAAMRPARVNSAANANRVLHGWAQFEVEDDVTVFVDGTMVPRSRLSHYRLTEGTHTVKLVKRGYMPISNDIKIRSGKITVVKAKPN